LSIFNSLFAAIIVCGNDWLGLILLLNKNINLWKGIRDGLQITTKDAFGVIEVKLLADTMRSLWGKRNRRGGWLRKGAEGKVKEREGK
jgi:hypothetical protein